MIVGMPLGDWRRLAYAFGVILVLLAAWQIAQTIPIGDPDLFPTPTTIARLTWETVAAGALWTNGAASLSRVLTGWALAIALGVPLGLAIGSWQWVNETVGSVVHALRPISPTAWIPLAILLFGFGFRGPVFIVFLASFYPIVLGAAAAVGDIEPIQINSLRTLGANQVDIVREVLLPGSLPSVLLSLRIALGNAWGAVVAAEMFGAQNGLGWFITQGIVFFQLQDILVGMLLIGMVGFVLDGTYLQLMSRLLRWMPSLEAVTR